MEQEKKVRGPKYTEEQKKALIDLLTWNEKLVTGKVTQTHTAKKIEEDWRHIAGQLNNMPGATKGWRQWRKTWQDIKTRVKGKAADIGKEKSSTVGGPFTFLTPLEEQILSIITSKAINGLRGTEDESAVKIEFESAEMSEEEDEEDEDVEEEEVMAAAKIDIEEPEITLLNTVTERPQQMRRTSAGDDRSNGQKECDKRTDLKKFYDDKLALLKERNEILQRQSEERNNLLRERNAILRERNEISKKLNEILLKKYNNSI